MEFLFRDRGQGKRQVKVSQDIALFDEQFADESSDDSEFKCDEEDDENDSGTSSGSDSGSSDGGDEEQSEEGEEAPEDEEVDAVHQGKLTTQELLSICKKELVSLSSPGVPETLLRLPKICACCLGGVSSDANEIVECDGCGIAVHEGCYGIAASFPETGSVSSTVSSASTEPWFCEPCRAGLSRPPNCELCPVVGGVYKETDVGRWVHLVCALYVPGVAFGDPERLLNATIFEMNYGSWGRRVCCLCSQEDHASEKEEPPSDEDVYQITGGARLARTGVCIQCDAGMCKSFFHVTCAQAAGLLSEPTFVSSQPMSSQGVVDSYLAHCKLHSDKTVIKERRRKFLIQLAQTRKRRKDILDRQQAMHDLQQKLKSSSTSLGPEKESATQRIWRKLSKHRERFLADKKQNHDPWLPTQKMPRLLTTSAGALRKIQRLASLNSGVTIAQQQTQEVRAISIIDAKKKWHLPPSFTVEFVAYYEDRHRRIEELKTKVEDQLKLHADMKNEQAEVDTWFDKVNPEHAAAYSTEKSLLQKIQTIRDILKLGGTLPEADKVSALKMSQSEVKILGTPNLKVRSTVYSMQQQLKLSDNSKVSLKVCSICKKSHDQHLLAHCDKCKLYYHLGCLTPPLTRMPKKSKLYGWSCSECYPESTSAEEMLPVDEDSTDRKRKRRMAASRARMLTLVDAVNHSASDEDSNRQSVPSSMLKKASKKPKVEYSNDVTSAADPVKEEVDQLQILDVMATDSKAERKLLKKAEKERRKKEKQDRKKVMKSEVETNSPFKLKIKTVLPPQSTEIVMHAVESASGKSNGHPNSEVDDDQQSTSSSKPSRRSSTSGKRISVHRDVRTQCDKCDATGTNASLVRCDECKRCFHFSCLMPPLKKSPKVAGYSWHCGDCDPSDRDSDWHLD